MPGMCRCRSRRSAPNRDIDPAWQFGPGTSPGTALGHQVRLLAQAAIADTEQTVLRVAVFRSTAEPVMSALQMAPKHLARNHIPAKRQDAAGDFLFD